MSRPFRILLIAEALFLLLSPSIVPNLPITPQRIARATQGILFVAPTARGKGDCSEWANACTLQTALDQAQSGDEIWVRAGVHKPTTDNNPNISFVLKDGVALYGGFAGTETSRDARDWVANPTVLSGDIDNNDQTDGRGVVTSTMGIIGVNTYHVVYASSVYSTTILDGFIITAGNAVYGPGGGMDLRIASPTLRNLVLSGNRAAHGGGIYSLGGDPILTNVTFSGNRAYYGGGMYNSGGRPILINTAFIGNHADSGGGMCNWQSNPVLVNSAFYGNQAGYGGGIYNGDANPTLVNATFSGNSATKGGGIFNANSHPTLVNAILWGNSASEQGPSLYNYDSMTDVSYSNIEGCGPSGANWHLACGTDSGGNIDADPRFVNAARGNLRLQLDSPCVDAGDNSAIPSSVITDLDGNSRFVDIPDIPDRSQGSPPVVDMGAYEVQPLSYRLHLPLILRSAR